jgi:hypothetical protein
MPIAPTLLVGLGGTGSQIIEKVYDKVRETGGSQSDRISYVVFDTDINDLRGIKRRKPDIKVVQTSTRATVGEYLNVNTFARDTWFPVNEILNRKTLTEGAAQVRGISRLAFDTTLKSGNLVPMHNGIDELFRIDADQEEQALRVILVSSLAGGTGSGLILPVAMYLSRFLRAKYPKVRAITRGFFIQPDVFFSVIPAAEEQRNLQVNAYATVRELDAFLMKGDNTLDPMYKDLTFDFPKLDGDGVEEVKAMPYDFCFLFGAGNSMSSSLGSFEEYKDHAATCVYTMSLGPMSKKSNSREDNVLREVIKNDGRNRYVGAGASRLLYPWNHLRDYVAYEWADEALSDQWLKYDHEIDDLRAAQAKQRASGFAVKDLDPAATFIGLVEAQASTGDPLSRALVNQCLLFDDNGLAPIGEQWIQYLGALTAFVKAEAAKAPDAGRRRQAEGQIGSLPQSKSTATYLTTFNTMEVYRQLAERNSEEVAAVTGYALFQSEADSITKRKLTHHLETYLREATSGDFIHPVAVRYFLYKVLEELKGAKQVNQTNLERTKKFYENFSRSAFQNPKEDSAQSPAQWAATYKAPFFNKMSKKPDATLQNMTLLFTNYVAKVKDLSEQTAMARVLEDALTYVQGLCASFEMLFRSLDSNLKKLSSDVQLHRTKYDDLRGSTTRYVLATSSSLDYMFKSMPYTGTVIGLDPELAETIYLKVREFHMLRDGRNASHFQGLYDNDMLGYFRDQVDLQYKIRLEMDIIDALKTEFAAQNPDRSDDDANNYVVAEIEKVKHLAAPFIDPPVGAQRHPIHACAYNPSIAGSTDPKRRAMVSEHLGNYGGEVDDEIKPQEILFYNAIYGIRARDLTKYAPARLEGTDKRPAGECFDAYYQLVSQIKPSVTATKVITPHIDRRWHTVWALPDLDEANQAAQFRDIHAAFFAGIALGVIQWDKFDATGRIYRYQPRHAVAQELMVSNGTPCDLFYEVHDALSINPVAVREVLDAVEYQIGRFLEKSHSASFKGSPIDKALEAGLPVEQLRDMIPTMKDRRITLLDIPTFVALTAPHQELGDAQLRAMSLDVVEYVHQQVARMNEPQDVRLVLTGILCSAFEDFEGNVALYLDYAGPQFASKIRAIVRPLLEFLEEHQMDELAQKVSKFDSWLRS